MHKVPEEDVFTFGRYYGLSGIGIPAPEIIQQKEENAPESQHLDRNKRKNRI